MEQVLEGTASGMDCKSAVEEEAEADDRVWTTSSDLNSDGLDVTMKENSVHLTETNVSPPSVETPAMNHVDAAAFMTAATQGKLDVVDKYLADGGSPNVHDELKRTALHRASIEGQTIVVQSLLEKGANVNFKDQLESSAIHWACRGGSLEVVKVLKSHGADMNLRDKLHSTPLHVATRTGHVNIVEYLLTCEVKVDLRDREGDTALHDAVRLNRYKIAEMLIFAGADTKIKNSEGKTAVQQVKEWQLDILETLQRLEKMKEVGHASSETPQERSE